jgi:hypothetical protein
MTTLLKNVRRFALILGSVLVAGPLVTVLASAAQAPAQPLAAAPSIVLHGSAAGGVRLIQTGQVLTFDFTETNQGSAVGGDDLVVEKLAGAKGTGVPLCVVADGSAINPDGSRCEPGTLPRGRSASFVITTKVTGKAGQDASARLCVQNEATQALGPCRTVSVKIA